MFQHSIGLLMGYNVDLEFVTTVVSCVRVLL